MKSLYKGALSAKAGANAGFTRGILRACKIGISMTVLALLFSSCNRESNGQTAGVKKIQSDSTIKPKVDIKVNS